MYRRLFCAILALAILTPSLVLADHHESATMAFLKKKASRPKPMKASAFTSANGVTGLTARVDPKHGKAVGASKVRKERVMKK
jgi:hypothetical protein